MPRDDTPHPSLPPGPVRRLKRTRAGDEGPGEAGGEDTRPARRARYEISSPGRPRDADAERAGSQAPESDAFSDFDSATEAELTAFVARAEREHGPARARRPDSRAPDSPGHDLRAEEPDLLPDFDSEEEDALDAILARPPSPLPAPSTDRTADSESESELEYVVPAALPTRRADGSVIEPPAIRRRFKAPYPLYGFARIEGRLNDRVPADFLPEPVERPETLVLDFNTLDRRMPQFLPGEAFEEIYGAAARRDFADTELVREENDSFRPRDSEAFARSLCADMKMMVSDGGNTFWLRPERHDYALEDWCGLYGGKNVRLRDAVGHFHTRDRFNELHRTQYKPRPAFDAFAAFTGRSGRTEIPPILVQSGPETFVSAPRFFRDLEAGAPREAAARRTYLSGELARRNFWIAAPTGDSYFNPGTSALTNRPYLERVLTAHGLDPATLRNARPPDLPLPSVLVRADGETFLSGRAAAARAAAHGQTLRQAHAAEDIFMMRPFTRGRGGNYSNPGHFRFVDFADMSREAIELLHLRADDRGHVDLAIEPAPRRSLDARPPGGDRGR